MTLIAFTLTIFYEGLVSINDDKYLLGFIFLVLIKQFSKLNYLIDESENDADIVLDFFLHENGDVVSTDVADDRRRNSLDLQLFVQLRLERKVRNPDD